MVIAILLLYNLSIIYYNYKVNNLLQTKLYKYPSSKQIQCSWVINQLDINDNLITHRSLRAKDNRETGENPVRSRRCVVELVSVNHCLSPG